MTQQRRPDPFTPGEQCGGFTLGVILVVGRPVLRLHADSRDILPGMTADPQMVVEDFHNLARSAHIHLLLYQSARYGIVVVGRRCQWMH
ncbi:hypothetical protein H681_19660 [Pseudomonas sp. ATCC 13867]|nr:hypothetical protein H681_19660 [Pseudomonas sp. ATCC 13867]